MITLICGIPNAGKTTFSKQFCNVLHQDNMGTLNHIVEIIEQKNNNDVIIEGYFGTKEDRCKIINAYNGCAKCIFINITVDESIRREDRNRNPQILRNAFKFFEPPTLDEGWEKIIVIEEKNGESISYTIEA